MGKNDKGLVPVGKIIGERFSNVPARIDPPPIPPTEHSQMNLFGQFLANTAEQREGLSNVIDFWDCIPRYAVSQLAQNKARTVDNFLGNHTAEFQYLGRTYACIISPARIEDEDEVVRDYYPSANEELVEEALRKIAADRDAGFFDKPNYQSGVQFSLYRVAQELARHGKSRSHGEIERSLRILSKSIIEIRSAENGEKMAISPYLPSLVAVSKTRLKEDSKAKWMVHFHPFVTRSIDQLAYRQYNYGLMMKHKSQLARWLHRQLALKYTFAEITKPFEMRYSTIKRDSSLLNEYSRERAAIEAVEDAFKELKSADILYSCTRKNITGPRNKIYDAIFTLSPSLEFVTEVKAANKRKQLTKLEE